MRVKTTCRLLTIVWQRDDRGQGQVQSRSYAMWVHPTRKRAVPEIRNDDNTL